MLFPGGIEDTSNATLILSVAAAVIYGIIVDTRPTLARTVVKTLAVALLAVLAFVRERPVAAVRRAGAERRRRRLSVARRRHAPSWRASASFLAAHLVYIALFWLAGGGAGIVLAETVARRRRGRHGGVSRCSCCRCCCGA